MNGLRPQESDFSLTCSAPIVQSSDHHQLLENVEQDFASSTTGAKPLSQLCLTKTANTWSIFRHLTVLSSDGVSGCGSAYLALEDNDGCWEFHGNRGQVGIRLSGWTKFKHIRIGSGRTVEESPREMILWGMIDGRENTEKFSSSSSIVRNTLMRHAPPQISPPSLDGYHFIPLASFLYDLNGPVLQDFPAFTELEGLGLEFGVVVLQILSNWGGPSTSVCRINVLGL